MMSIRLVRVFAATLALLALGLLAAEPALAATIKPWLCRLA